MRHYRSTAKKAAARNSSEKNSDITCSLCQAVEGWQILEDAGTMRVIKNRVPYDIFDGLPTTGRHYMVVPKRHVCTIGELTDTEKLAMVNLLAKYEAKGFSIYSRSQNNVNRTQQHLHTHLIELSGQKFNFLIYTAKPYLLLASKRKRAVK